METSYLSRYFVLCLLLLSNCSPKKVLTTSPQIEYNPNSCVAYYSFDDNAVNINSGSETDGVLHGNSSFSKGIKGNALLLDGDGDYVELGQNFNIADEFAVSLWIAPFDLKRKAATLFSKYEKAGSGPYSFYLQEDKPAVWISYTNGQHIEIVSEKSIEANRWTHLVWTHSLADGVTLYINCVPDRQYPKRIHGTTVNNNQKVTIGRQSLMFQPFYDLEYSGMIDEIKIFNYPISPEQVYYEHFLVKPKIAEGPKIVDIRDSVEYSTVRIGKQLWLAENLKYRPTPQVGQVMSMIPELKGYKVFGYLYDVKSALIACPDGWTLPSTADWMLLFNNLGANGLDGVWGLPNHTKNGAIGQQLKSTTGWHNNENGYDIYGFNAIPLPNMHAGNSITGLGTKTSYWTSTEWENFKSPLYYSIGFTDYSKDVYVKEKASSWLRYVRCLKYEQFAKPKVSLNTFVDPRDQNQYEFVEIGDQVWMAENLAYLPKVNPGKQWSESEPNYYVYKYNGKDIKEAKNTPSYKNFGVLYDWKAAKLACPDGWHLPSDFEWKKLEVALGMITNEIEHYHGFRSKGDVGDKLKSTKGWINDGSGTNSTGFNAYPVGAHLGYFLGAGQAALFWSSTSYNPHNRSEITDVYFRQLEASEKGVYRYSEWVGNGMSVRCLKD